MSATALPVRPNVVGAATAAPASSAAPAEHCCDDATTPAAAQFTGPLVTVSLAGLPATVNNGHETSFGLPPFLPEVHPALVTAFMAFGEAKEAGADNGSSSAYPADQQPSLVSLSHSVRSSDLNQLLLTPAPLLSPFLGREGAVQSGDSPPHYRLHHGIQSHCGVTLGGRAGGMGRTRTRRSLVFHSCRWIAS